MWLISTNSGLHSARPDKDRFPMQEAPAVFKKAGFEAMDINFCATIYEGRKHECILDGENYLEQVSQVKAACDANGLAMTVSHLPFYNYLMEDKEHLAFCDEMTRRAIKASAHIGVKYAVIHPHRDEAKNILIRETVDALRPFVEMGKALGVTLCVENMYTVTAEDTRKIADALDCGICWDVGHANFGGHDQYTGIMTCGDRLKVLHLHDNNAKADLHLPPFQGNIDWHEVMRGLRDVHFEGELNFEVAVSGVPEEMREPLYQYIAGCGKLLREKY
ncbi:MAG: sugar phosphate isomerase/epimerase [Clostridia bacterium]|nr:sugar phosphate isomerase/epimerase [Clostridia bacterium]